VRTAAINSTASSWVSTHQLKQLLLLLMVARQQDSGEPQKMQASRSPCWAKSATHAPACDGPPHHPVAEHMHILSLQHSTCCWLELQSIPDACHADVKQVLYAHHGKRLSGNNLRRTPAALTTQPNPEVVAAAAVGHGGPKAASSSSRGHCCMHDAPHHVSQHK
jgi:hypothetical protein